MSLVDRVFEALPNSVQRRSKIALASVGAAIRITPTGALLFEDIRRRLPGESLHLIFDVGANVGQSAEKFAVHYPGAKVWSFEPSPTTFQVLQRTLKKIAGATAYNLGFGKASSTVRFDTSSNLSVLHQIAEDQSNGTLPEVSICTIDDFCAKNSVDHIDYLKIDTEGNDLNVLLGAEQMLRNSAIKIVVVECSMNPENQRHVSFHDFYRFMCDRQYRVFGLYEQTEEFVENRPQLRRANAAFISPSLIRRQ